MYKESQYNIKVFAPDGVLLLYNTKKGAFVSVFPENREKIERLLARPDNCLKDSEEYFQNLLKGGFVVPDETDEYKEVLDNFKKAIEAKEIQLELMPAETCNFRCPYCYEELRHIMMTSDIQQGVVRFAEKLSNDVRALHIHWYGGEPTLAKEIIIKIMEGLHTVMKAKNVEWDAGMTTNGYLLNSSDFKKYFSLGIRFFQVTIDGNKEDHNRLRILRNGEGTFDIIWANLHEIKRLEEEFIIRVRVNFHRENYKRMYEFADIFANEFGGDQRFFIAFRPVWKGDFQRKDLPVCSTLEGMSLQNKLTLYALSKAGRIEDIQVINPVPRPIGVWCQAQYRNHLTIGADGKCWKCDLTTNYIEESIGTLTKNGEVKLKQDLFSKWIDPDIYAQDSACIQCKFLPICQGGCALNRIRGNRVCLFDNEIIKEAMISRYQLVKIKKGE